MHLPNSTVYIAREADYYSASAVENPWCIVQPKSANEVALTVKTLLASGSNWAVRCGGHTAWGASADSTSNLFCHNLLFVSSRFVPRLTMTKSP